ncbi:class I SAM-dependent methyltransferase [Methylobacterium oryzihabitans]|uniref:Class I SAM-dependent methyltransferase n=1 Tax=Methylobacterium oryzihabitans TaxID=2499852 RepID=A0A3S2VUM3_9HYPH|nr:class I SAM-dependent methyltransferase [Methylobacterium oryzihabitans]RVU21487.1 class I SAM-dependent methyltransferase [Methylobacterium oryzihabitans]
MRRLTRACRAAAARLGAGTRAAKPHFVVDYQRAVAALLRSHPVDEAMSLAVGGGYEHVGRVETAILRHYGIADGMALLDFGCGSGRLAHAVSQQLSLDYVGIDVVPDLLAYARTRTPADYRYIVNHELTLPLPDASRDMVAAFSVLTHLNHIESYLYLEEMRRVLRPGGTAVVSFIEFGNAAHWRIFEETVAARRHKVDVPLNQLIEPSVMVLWAERLGLTVEAILAGGDAPWGEAGPLGQSLAVLRKP